MEKLSSSLSVGITNEATFANQISQATSSLQNLLQQFAQAPNFSSELKLAFGDSVDVDFLSQSWLGREVTLPKIAIVNRREIGNADGAFSQDTQKIYLAEEFLVANQNNLNIVRSVLLEEYGHFVDSQLKV